MMGKHDEKTVSARMMRYKTQRTWQHEKEDK